MLSVSPATKLNEVVASNIMICTRHLALLYTSHHIVKCFTWRFNQTGGKGVVVFCSHKLVACDVALCVCVSLWRRPSNGPENKGRKWLPATVIAKRALHTILWS